jgi:hypothetical protein
MSYIKIDGTGHKCKIISDHKFENRHMIKLDIEGDRATLREFLRIEKHGSCRIDFENYSVLAVLSMSKNITIGSGRGALTRSSIAIMWCDN